MNATYFMTYDSDRNKVFVSYFASKNQPEIYIKESHTRATNVYRVAVMSAYTGDVLWYKETLMIESNNPLLNYSKYDMPKRVDFGEERIARDINDTVYQYFFEDGDLGEVFVLSEHITYFSTIENP